MGRKQLTVAQSIKPDLSWSWFPPVNSDNHNNCNSNSNRHRYLKLSPNRRLRPCRQLRSSPSQPSRDPGPELHNRLQCLHVFGLSIPTQLRHKLPRQRHWPGHGVQTGRLCRRVCESEYFDRHIDVLGCAVQCEYAVGCGQQWRELLVEECDWGCRRGGISSECCGRAGGQFMIRIMSILAPFLWLGFD